MDKELLFDAQHARYIDWNKLMPEMLDVWRALKITKSDDGDVLIEVLEEEQS